MSESTVLPSLFLAHGSPMLLDDAGWVAQLGAWAQQRHTWALHAKMTVMAMCITHEWGEGMVEPYPKFFAGLGGWENIFDDPAVGGELIDDKIVEFLDKEKITIARRTVAKYREMMGILPSSRRKKFF